MPPRVSRRSPAKLIFIGSSGPRAGKDTAAELLANDMSMQGHPARIVNLGDIIRQEYSHAHGVDMDILTGDYREEYREAISAFSDRKRAKYGQFYFLEKIENIPHSSEWLIIPSLRTKHDLEWAQSRKARLIYVSRLFQNCRETCPSLKQEVWDHPLESYFRLRQHSIPFDAIWDNNGTVAQLQAQIWDTAIHFTAATSQAIAYQPAQVFQPAFAA
jgi:phosphomevalonate kinase